MRQAVFSEVIDFTRPGTATYVDSAGVIQTAAADQPRFDYTNGRRQLLLEGSATNLLLNSDELETQSVTTSAETYTLSFYGTGTVTLTGAASSSLAGTGVNDRVSLTFSATAGSLALTVSGSVNNSQLETGSVASSYIPTSGTTVTRPTDNAQLTETVAALLREGAVSVLVQGQGLSGADGRFIGGSAGTRLMGLNGAENAAVAGSSTTLPVSATAVQTTKFGFSLAYDASGKRGSYNGSAVVNDATAMDADLTTAYIGRDNIGNFANGRYDQLVIWPFRMIDADLKAKSLVDVIPPTTTDFVFTVTTTAANEIFTIPCFDVGVFDAVIDWGDGASSTVTAYNDVGLAHEYASAGDHQIRISGSFPNIYFNNSGDRLKLKSVENFGVVGWIRLHRAFYGCGNLISFIAGNTDTSSVTNMGIMFRDCPGLATLDVSGFDTANVTNMNIMFYNCSGLATIDVSGFDTANVTNMNSMFSGCSGVTDIIGVEDFGVQALNNSASLNLFAFGVQLPTARYDALLINWAAQDPFDGMSPNFGTSKYTGGGAAETARSKLVSVDGWTITDGGAA